MFELVWWSGAQKKNLIKNIIEIDMYYIKNKIILYSNNNNNNNWLLRYSNCLLYLACTLLGLIQELINWQVAICCYSLW
jgi:hypothetical protein